MTNPFAELERRLATVTVAFLANATAVRNDGVEFPVEFSVADETRFDHVVAGDYVIEYEAAAALSDGEQLVVDGRAYTVVGVPRRKGRHIHFAELVPA